MWLRRMFAVALIAGGSFVFAQEVRVPYQLGLDIGYIAAFGGDVTLNGEETFSSTDDYSGSGNTRIGADAIVNLGQRKRFGLGLAYRRIAPDTGFVFNAFGPIISHTNAWTRSVVSVLSLSGGYATVKFDDDYLDEDAFGSVTYESGFGFYGELQWKLAFPIVELSEMRTNRSLNLAPHLAIAAGAAVAVRDVTFESFLFEDDDYYLVPVTGYTTVSIGATLMVLDRE